MNDLAQTERIERVTSFIDLKYLGTDQKAPVAEGSVSKSIDNKEHYCHTYGGDCCDSGGNHCRC